MYIQALPETRSVRTAAWSWLVTHPAHTTEIDSPPTAA